MQGGEVLRFTVVARHEGDSGFGHERLGLRFAAHGADGRGGGADEDQAGGGAGFGEGGVFGEEAVAGVDGLRAADARGFQDGFDAQVGVARGGGADAVGFVGHRDVLGGGIGVGMDGDGAQAHAARGADDAAGDFAAIGDQ